MDFSELDNRYFPAVDQAIPTRDYRVYLYFDDGSIRLYNARPLLDLPVFHPLKNTEVFLGTCTVLNGTLAWDLAGTFDDTKCLDVDPLELYRVSPEVSEPEWVLRPWK